MGFRKPMDYNSINHQIYMAGVEIMDSRNDGWTQWEIKEELYRLQLLINTILEKSPKFEGEDEFLKTLEQHKMVKILGG
jgi:vancomycin permeability regulator SanA